MLRKGSRFFAMAASDTGESWVLGWLPPPNSNPESVQGRRLGLSSFVLQDLGSAIRPSETGRVRQDGFPDVLVPSDAAFGSDQICLEEGEPCLASRMFGKFIFINILSEIWWGRMNLYQRWRSLGESGFVVKVVFPRQRY